LSKMTVFSTDNGSPIEIDSSELVRTAVGGYAIRNGYSVGRGALNPSPDPTSTEAGLSASSRLVKLEARLAQIDERLASLERRVDAEGSTAVKTIVRDERGRITSLLSEPAVIRVRR
jgi:hypothetical protein